MPGHLEIDSASQLHLCGLLVDEQHLHLAAWLAPAQGVLHGALGDGDLLEGLGVHEMRLAAVRIQELHLPGLRVHRAKLLPRPERPVDHVAIKRPAQLRAHERTALSGLYVLEVEDLEDRPVDLYVVSVLELVGTESHIAYLDRCP
jgi:hypothetical protein